MSIMYAILAIGGLAAVAALVGFGRNALATPAAGGNRDSAWPADHRSDDAATLVVLEQQEEARHPDQVSDGTDESW